MIGQTQAGTSVSTKKPPRSPFRDGYESFVRKCSLSQKKPTYFFLAVFLAVFFLATFLAAFFGAAFLVATFFAAFLGAAFLAAFFFGAAFFFLATFSPPLKRKPRKETAKDENSHNRFRRVSFPNQENLPTLSSGGGHRTVNLEKEITYVL